MILSSILADVQMHRKHSAVESRAKLWRKQQREDVAESITATPTVYE